MTLSIYLLIYFLILFAVLGYGFFFNSILELKKFNFDYGILGLIGVLFIIIYSYISHYLFIKHTILHNVIFLTLGFLFFINFQIKNKKIEDLKLLTFFFIIIFLGFILFKTHDDFPYYHFPYTYHLTQNSLMLGIGNFNHGFRTPSSIFYLNSIFYLPFVKYNFFHMGAILFMGFAVTSLFSDLSKKIKKPDLDNVLIFKVLSFIFIMVFFYRIQEHGTDRSAQILILLVASQLIDFRRNYEKLNFNKKIIIILLLTSLIISLKAVYLIYVILFLPIIYYLYLDKELKKLKIIFTNSFFYIFCATIVLIILNYLFNTGCLIYPLADACLSNLDWSIHVDEVNRMSLHYEQWSKAGSGPGFTVENHTEYVMYFNWFDNWVEKYFFNKVSDFLLGLLFLCALVFFTFHSKIKNDHKFKDTNLIYVFYIILAFEWFYNHPSLRYGGYCLLAILFFLPLSNFLDKFKQNYLLKKKIYTLIIIAILVFVGRNMNRLNNEHQVYKFDFLKNPQHRIIEQNFRIDKKINKLINKYQNCNYDPGVCDYSKGLIVKRIFGIYSFSKNKKK